MMRIMTLSVCEPVTVTLMRVCLLFSLLNFFFLFFFWVFSSTHDDLGCQGQARRKSTSSTLPLEGLAWMTPATK